MPAHNGRYYQKRLSRDKRDALSLMYHALYQRRNGESTLVTKKKSSAEVVKSDSLTQFTFKDANGVEQTLDLTKVKNLGDTAYAESKKLFPDATPCMIEQDGTKFDPEGRENVINDNICIISARWMTKGDYGPWFLVQAAHPRLGEISVPAPGRVCNEAVAYMAGIDLKTGRPTVGRASELPVWARFEFVPDAGGYGNGYFVIMPALQQLEAVADSDE